MINKIVKSLSAGAFVGLIGGLSVIGMLGLVLIHTDYIQVSSEAKEVIVRNEENEKTIQDMEKTISDLESDINKDKNTIEELEKTNLDILSELSVKTDIINQIGARQDREFYENKQNQDKY